MSTHINILNDNIHMPSISDGYDLPIRQFVALLQCRRLHSSLDSLLKVEGNIAELLFNVLRLMISYSAVVVKDNLSPSGS
jgi:hypothetical protein